MLHAQAELRHRRIGIVGIQRVESLRENRRCSRAAGLPVCTGICEFDVVGCRLTDERRRAGRIVDVVALDALVESAKAAANYRLAVSGHVVGETNSGHPGLVIVLDQCRWCASLTGDIDAVHVKRADRVRLEARSAFNECPGFWIEARGGGKPRLIMRGIEVGNLVVAFPGVRHHVVAETILHCLLYTSTPQPSS